MNNLKEQLIKRGYKVSVFETSDECTAYLNNEIDSTTVGIGGSATVAELGLYPLLKEHNTVFWHGDAALREEIGDKAIRENAMSTDIYISSVNAISEDGVIINIDGMGNRIASMAYGHKKVYLLIGKNKIAENTEKAIWRAKNIASPKNAKRLNRKTPCAVKGDKCYDCDSPERICRGTLILERAMSGAETEIVLINEELGF